MLFRGVTQLGRVLGLGPRCRRFKSCHLDQINTPHRKVRRIYLACVAGANLMKMWGMDSEQG